MGKKRFGVVAKFSLNSLITSRPLSPDQSLLDSFMLSNRICLLLASLVEISWFRNDLYKENALYIRYDV